MAWLKRPPAEQAPVSPPLQLHRWQPRQLLEPPQQQQQTLPPRPIQQQPLPPQLPLPQLAGSMPELATAGAEPPQLTMAEAVAAVAAGAAAAAAADAAAASDPAAVMLGLYSLPSAPVASRQPLQRGSAPSLGPLRTSTSPLAPLIPPSRSLDSARLPHGLPGLRSLSDERLGAAFTTAGGSTSWSAVDAAQSMQAATGDLLPCFLEAWEPQHPQRLPLPVQQPGSMLDDLPQLLPPGCQPPGQRGSGDGSSGSPAAHGRAASQHRFLSQLQQQGLQHQLDGAAQGMQLT